MNNVMVVNHPLVQHKLALLRDKETSCKSFRDLARELAALLCYEVTRDLALESLRIETPVTPTNARVLSPRKVEFAPILRAGMVLLEGMLQLIPSARVSCIGLYRDPETLDTVEYYFKTPADLPDRLVIAVDAVIATGNTAVAALDRLKEHGAVDLRYVCLVATPAGLANVEQHHPTVRVWTAAIDEGLDERGYVVPGLGDAGDRMYGTN